MAGTILLMDNNKAALDKWSSLLEEFEYHVVKASSLEEAEKLLREKWIHLAILDIRMTDDDDQNDIGGLLLAQKPEFSTVPKIILTAHPSFEYARSALASVTEYPPPAVNFIAKTEKPQVLIDAIGNIFANQIRINWDLDIGYDPQEPVSFPHLASFLQPNIQNKQLVQFSSELEDLIRKLFFDYQHIRMGRLLWHDAHRFCLPVLTQALGGATGFVILVCGERELLRKEQELREKEKLVPNIPQGTELRDHAETTHLGANLYVLSGTNIEMIQTMRDFFQTGRERNLKIAFTHLLGNILKSWHELGQKVEAQSDLMSIYRQWTELEMVPRSDVEKRIEALIYSIQGLGGIQVKRNNGQVKFNFPEGTSRSFPDPVAVIYTPFQQYDGSVIYRISPGKLTSVNVLVDAKLKTWLTDFAQAGQAPQWWDLVCLEAAVRFDLSHAPDFPAWQEFEEYLVKPVRLDESLEQNEVIPELRMSLALIEQIRRQASIETGPDSAPYSAGLLAWIVSAMMRYDPGVLFTQDRLRAGHLLLAACMVAGRLESVTDISLPVGRLSLDENGKVWLGERRIAALAGLRLKLLQCLIDHEGQAVNHQVITKEAYEEQYIAGDNDQDQRIRQEIRRLREEIEPDPNRPRYIVNERGRGYRLNASGEPEK